MKYLLSILFLLISSQTFLFADKSSEWGFIEYSHTDVQNNAAKHFKHYGCIELPHGTSQSDAEKTLLQRFITNQYGDQKNVSDIRTWTKQYSTSDTYYFLACDNITKRADGKPICNDPFGLSMFKSTQAKDNYDAYQKIMQQYGNGDLVRFCFNYYLPGSTTSINPNSIIGTVISRKGNGVTAKSPNGASRTLDVGSSIYGNDKIQTTANSAATIVFSDSTAVTIAQNSELDVYASTNELFRVKSDSGLFEWVTGLISKFNPSGFQLNAKTMAIGIRGTKFILDINKTYTRELTIDGIVTVSENGKTVEVKQGFKITKDDRTDILGSIEPIDPKTDGGYFLLFNDLKKNMSNINDDFFKGELQ